MGRTIFRSGNSTVVSLPPEVLEALELEPGDEVTIVADPERRRIVVTPTGTAGAGVRLEGPARLGELIERYAPALERLVEVEERERRAASRGIESEALERAQALREAFTARHGVLDVDLVEAARQDRQGQADGALDLTREDEGHDPGR